MESHRLYWGYNKICEIRKSKIIFDVNRKNRGRVKWYQKHKKAKSTIVDVKNKKSKENKNLKGRI